MDWQLYTVSVYLLFFTVSELSSFRWATAVIALICFVALREYFSLIAFRSGDRLGILRGFLSIPLMVSTLLMHNHNIFIAAMPLYVFFITFLVAIGGEESAGTVFFIGIIGVGIFLFVFCNGLLAFLTISTPWIGIIFLINVFLTYFFQFSKQPGNRKDIRR